MWDGVALQNGTSHYFGQHFAKAFGIQFLDKDNTLKTPYQTSWGVSTRMIGGLIMTHSDNRGLVLPPKIAPIKVCIIPIGDVTNELSSLEAKLNANNITYKVDNSDKTPGFKFALAEVKGYPIRIELGKRDLDNGFITLVRRDTLEKIKVNTNEDIISAILELLNNIQTDMYNKALERRNNMLYKANTYDEFKKISSNGNGFIEINLCNDPHCEDKIKEDTGLKSRCIIDKEVDNTCIVCGKKANYKVYFGRQY